MTLLSIDLNRNTLNCDSREMMRGERVRGWHTTKIHCRNQTIEAAATWHVSQPAGFTPLLQFEISCFGIWWQQAISPTSGFKISYQTPLGDVTDVNPLFFYSQWVQAITTIPLSLSLNPAVAAWHAADVSSLQTWLMHGTHNIYASQSSLDLCGWERSHIYLLCVLNETIWSVKYT